MLGVREGEGREIEKREERQSVGLLLFFFFFFGFYRLFLSGFRKGFLRLCFLFLFFFCIYAFFFFNIVLTWKIVGASEVSILYIYIYIY